MNILLRTILVALSYVVVFGIHAQGYPDKPVKIIVGFAPGGSSDTVARLVAQRLAPMLGQPVVVENKSGGTGVPGADFVAKAPGDGHTLLLATSGHATTAAIMKKLPFDPVRDFAWITMVTTYPLVFATASQSHLKSLPDLISRAKAQPGTISYSSTGVGSALHLVGEWFSAETGVELLHIPFRGGPSTLTEVLSGRIDIMVETVTLALPHIQSGKLRALAVTSRLPMDFLPGVPPVNQTVPGFEFQSWLGIAAPPATPVAVVERLNKDIHRILEQPDMRQRLADLGGAAAPTSPDTMRTQVEAEVTRWRRLVEARAIERQ
jgi:tripartite-type tricarboxylate transporter receptor subunit TctC